MSMVPTYVKASDGRWYKNPVLSGDGWFICYDDSDPIELVIKVRSPLSPVDVFEKARLKATAGKKAKRMGRCFGKDFRVDSARCWWIRVEGKVPAESITEHDGVFDELPQGDCVYYG